MKRHLARFVAAGLLLSGGVVACTGDLLEVGADRSSNPFVPEAEALVTGLIDHATAYAQQQAGDRNGRTLRDPGLLLLEAIDAFEPLAVDINVEEVGRALAQARLDRAGKKPSDRPWENDPTLSEAQKRWVHAALDRAGGVRSSQELGRRFARLERRAVAELGSADARPVLVLTAVLSANYGYFTHPGNAGKVRRLLHALSVAAAGEDGMPRFLRMQDATSPERPPPSFGDYFNPGTWWDNTLGDTRDAAQLGVLAGAGIGCIAGWAASAPGCAVGGGAGGFLGGLVGVAVGGVVSGVANYIESVHNYNQAESAWCAEQRRLNPVLRHRDFYSLCDANHQ